MRDRFEEKRWKIKTQKVRNAAQQIHPIESMFQRQFGQGIPILKTRDAGERNEIWDILHDRVLEDPQTS